MTLANGNAAEAARVAERLAGTVDWLHLEDAEGEAAGAPQNVEATHRILSETKLPVQFRGGINLVHTAEMMIALGVSRVILDAALHKTERSPTHFYTRLGEHSVAAVANLEEALQAESLGAHRVLFTAPVTSLGSLRIPAVAGFLVHNGRNREELESVGFEGLLVASGAKEISKC